MADYVKQLSIGNDDDKKDYIIKDEEARDLIDQANELIASLQTKEQELDSLIATAQEQIAANEAQIATNQANIASNSTAITQINSDLLDNFQFKIYSGLSAIGVSDPTTMEDVKSRLPDASIIFFGAADASQIAPNNYAVGYIVIIRQNVARVTVLYLGKQEQHGVWIMFSLQENVMSENWIKII